MREIKFRAWDKQHREWITERLGLFLNGTIIVYDANAGDDDIISFRDKNSRCYIKDWYRDIELMQYTGLKDKNGKEIYEGDIVKVYDWGVKTSEDIIGISAIEWSDDTKGWIHNPEYDIDSYDMFRNVEVIGNIYENPELLVYGR